MFSNKKDFHFLSGFWLKIIGLVSMIFDHIAIFYLSKYADINLVIAFRSIGRISFIVFAFLIVEGVIHSKNNIKYLSRLLILSLVMDISELIIFKEYRGNPITTLFFGALIIYLLRLDKWYYKLTSLIPITLVILSSLDIIPLKMEYSLYGMTTILLFYLGYLIAKYFIKSISLQYGLDEDEVSKNNFGRTLLNLVPVLLFISFSIVIYILNPIWNGHGLFSNMMSIQVYAIFASIPLLLYNGKRGYNKPWFKYGCYVFFPLHIVILYLIFTFML